MVIDVMLVMSAACSANVTRQSLQPLPGHAMHIKMPLSTSGLRLHLFQTSEKQSIFYTHHKANSGCAF